MFRKVQLKFFGIIIAILIAIFIGVLSSINIIMDLMMERQTNIVLHKVAQSVDFDEKTKSFSFTNPEQNNLPPKKESRPAVTKKTTVAAPPTEKHTETVPPTAKPTQTNPPVVQTSPPETQTNPPVVQTEEIKTTVTEVVQTQPPQTQATEPPQTMPPTESPAPETAPPFEWGGEQYPNPWDNPWGNPWYPWHPWNPWNPGEDWNNQDKNGGNNNGGQFHDNSQYEGGGIKPAANNDFVPVLEGYTIMETSKKIPHSEFSMTNIIYSVAKSCDTSSITAVCRLATDICHVRNFTLVPVFREEFITLSDTSILPNEKSEDIPNPPEKGEPMPKSFGSIEFFVIMADQNGKYVASQNNDSLTTEAAQKYINEIMGENESSGMTGNISFCAEKKTNGTLMVLTDRTSELDMMRKLKRTTLIVGIISIILISAAAYFLSGIIVQPLKETFEKQKQFISDASHELKTPLTVISTNADVLEGEIGENKWLNYIQDQADRMNVLVNDLLSLSRLENSNRDYITADFDLSRAITNASLPFECQAFESRKNFVLNIEEGIYINGSEQHIKQMAGIFIDNALKYSKDGGTVRVSLTRDDNKVILSVYNTGSGVREEDVDKLFERFYRSDESRARATGGYGLGLAIAKSIIDKHKFKVQVENQEGRSICFVVTMQ